MGNKEKKDGMCDRHKLKIDRFVKKNADGTTESVSACELCAKILEGAGYKLEKAVKAGAFGIDEETLKRAKESEKRAFGDKDPWWLDY